MKVKVKSDCIVDGLHGIYVPQVFAERYPEFIQNQDDLHILLSGPDHDLYWEAWDEVLNASENLEQGESGDLFEIECIEADEVCHDCIMMIVNSELPDDASEERIEELKKIDIRWTYCGDCGDESSVVDFSWSPCDCCGSRLGGSRYGAVFMDEVS